MCAAFSFLQPPCSFNRIIYFLFEKESKLVVCLNDSLDNRYLHERRLSSMEVKRSAHPPLLFTIKHVRICILQLTCPLYIECLLPLKISNNESFASERTFFQLCYPRITQTHNYQVPHQPLFSLFSSLNKRITRFFRVGLCKRPQLDLDESGKTNF